MTIPDNPEQILLIRLSSIGDILLTFPLVQSLHHDYPDTPIDFIIGKEYQDVLTPVRHYLRNVIIYDKSNLFGESRRIRRIIRKNHYTIIADLHNNLRTRCLRSNRYTKIYRFTKQRIRRFFFVKWKWNVYDVGPVWKRYFQTVPLSFSKTDFQIQGFQADPAIVSQLKQDIPALDSGKKCMLIYPGARHFTKRWPLEYYRQLITTILEKTNYTIILGGSRDESSYLQPLTRPGNKRIIDTGGRYNLYENFILVSLCDLIISNDSAPMHMAALLGIKQIAFFGNTVREFGFYPENPNAVIMEDNTVSCRPCSHIGFEKCPKKHFQCMQNITPEMVIQNIK